jgi:hypothetical protein
MTFEIIFFVVMAAAIIYFYFFSKKVYPHDLPATVIIDPNSLDAEKKRLPPFDREKLKAWYMAAAIDHEFLAKKEIGAVKVVMVVQFLLFFVLYFALKDNTNNDESSIVFNWEILGSILFYVFLFLRYQWLLRRPVYGHLEKESFEEIKEGRFQHIRDICKQLTSDLGLTDHKLRIYYLKTNQFETHINFSDGCIHLFISRAAISLAGNGDILLKSIMAHEFGHVYQKDDKLFILNKMLLSWPGKLALISTGINCFISLLAMLNGVFVSGAVSIPAFFIIRAYTAVNKKRKEAENLADISSLAYVPGSKITYLIEKLATEESTSSYPSKAERLAFIEKTLAKIGQ